MLERASWCMDDVTFGTNNQVKEYGTQYLHMRKKKKLYMEMGQNKMNVYHSCLHLDLNLRNLVKKIFSYLQEAVQICGMNRSGVLCKGVIAQAKNGDELFWEEKFHAASGKTQACTQGALLFFPFKFGRG